jgi:elongation factor P
LPTTADFKVGLTIELDGEAYQIAEFEHVKPGKGGAFVRTKLRNVRTSSIYDKTFRAGERIELAHVSRRRMQFLYTSGDSFYFMDTEDFEQIELSDETVGEQSVWLKESEEYEVVVYDGEVIGIEIPPSVERQVTQTDPGLRGDTATGGTKPAVLEGGATVQVPLFVNVGDVVKVDTRQGSYIGRVN